MKIVLATDGSAHARLAEELLIRLPGIAGSTVTTVSVAPTPSLVAPGIPPLSAPTYGRGGESLWSELHRHAREVANAAQDRLAAEGFEATSVVMQGDASSEILTFVNQEDPDLVVVGSRGENALLSFLLGSVARRLVAYARCSVLIARHFDGLDAEASATRLRGTAKLAALVATDDSEGSRKAVDWVRQTGPNAWRRLVPVCIEPFTVLPPGLDPALIPEEIPVDVARAEAVAKEAAARLEETAAEVTPEYRIDRPSHALTVLAKEHGVDLVVIGAKGHSGLERFLLGSVSYEVATTAPCSVMIVR
jgi:nucleotide-binding universal stress UspA family protein